MRYVRAHSPSRLMVCSLAAIVLAVSAVSWRQISAKETVRAGTDLTDQVELKSSSTLLGSTVSGLFVNASIKNTTDEPLDGPILLLVEDTGVEKLTVDCDGYLESGEGFFTLVPGGETLDAGESSKPVKVRFASDDKLRRAERRAFELQAKVVRGEIANVPDEAEPARNPGAAPSAPSARGGSAANPVRPQQEQPKDSQPLQPEPASEPLPQQEEPESAPPQEQAPAGPTDEQVKRVMDIQNKFTVDAMNKPGVVGTGTALDRDGNLIIRVYVERAGIGNELPKMVEGVPVVPRVTGKLRAFQFRRPQDKRARAGQGNPANELPPDCVDNPKTRFDRPVPIGVSSISTTGPCASGTLGCRVIDSAGQVYALSNNHVFADENNAAIGSAISQPSPGDQVNICDTPAEDTIGTLFDFEPIRFLAGVGSSTNAVDAAIALVSRDDVSNATPCSSYGLPNSTTLPAVLGMKVQKYGRTTSWRSSTVTALNVTADIAYTGGLARFVNQIEFTNPDPLALPLGAPGDSGSLIVTTTGKNPVALLFAGSALVTLGNPIDQVLERFDVTIDGAPSNAGPLP